MQQGDLVKVYLDTSSENLKNLVTAHTDEVKKTVNAGLLEFKSLGAEANQVKLDSDEIKIAITL